MQTTALIFPGQGSQTPGMSAAFMAHPHTRELFEEADDALGFHLSRLMKDGPAEELTLTQNAQPALLIAGLAALLYMQKQTGKPLEALCAAVAGHSLGEYTAVAAAGGLSASLAAQLVRLRGQAMAKAVPAGQGGMSALLGLEVTQLESIAAATGITIANDNAPGQLIIAGSIRALEQAEEQAKAAGAKRALRLNVSGPFHTAAMHPAAQEVSDFLKSHPLHPLAVPVYANATTQPASDAATVTANLISQITSRVRWRESMTAMAEAGITTLLELGTGKVLTGLAARCDARLAAHSLTTPDEVDAFLAAR